MPNKNWVDHMPKVQGFRGFLHVAEQFVVGEGGQVHRSGSAAHQQDVAEVRVGDLAGRRLKLGQRDLVSKFVGAGGDQGF